MNNTLALSGAARWRKRALMFLVLVFVTFMVHAFVLRFIFPGYYRPLSLQHEDHYIPASFAYAAQPGYRALMNWSRPVFMVLLKLIGHAGSAGAIGYVIAVVLLNCILSAILMKRILGLPFNGTFLFFYAIYCYLLFATPYFYSFYTQDVGSQLCYFFLILGALLFDRTRTGPLLLSSGLLFVSCTVAFLSKETYQLAALFFSFLWFLYYRAANLKRSLAPLYATIAAIAISVLNNMRVHSVFVNVVAPKGSPYEVSLSPLSVLHEWIFYAKDGVNVFNFLMIGLIGYLILRFKQPWRKKFLFVFAACFMAAAFSWLPNSVLPNHHVKGYSFNGLYLFYLPLFFLPFFQRERLMTGLGTVVVLVLCLASHTLNVHKYKGDSNNEVVKQENILRNLSHSLDSLIGQLPRGPQPYRVLITGITFPYNPFTYPESLREYPHAPYAFYDVVYYSFGRRYAERRDLVKLIPVSDTVLTRYDQVWRFNEEGNVAGSSDGRSAARRAINGSEVNIDLHNLPGLKTEGIYPPEEKNGIAWTSGNAGIEFPAVISGKDSLTVALETYMAGPCKNIVPRVALIDTNSKTYQPLRTERMQDVFYYYFAPGKMTAINKVIISSKTINSGADKRVLSFPMKGLMIK